MIGAKKLMLEGDDRREDACEEKGMIEITGFHRNKRSGSGPCAWNAYLNEYCERTLVEVQEFWDNARPRLCLMLQSVDKNIPLKEKEMTECVMESFQQVCKRSC